MKSKRFRNKLTNEIWRTAERRANVVDQRTEGGAIAICVTRDGFNYYVFDYLSVSDFDRTWEDIDE